MRKIAIIIAAIVAAVIALSLMGAPRAEAAPLSAAGITSVEPRCSLPYVDDVNEWGKGHVILTVYCCGNAKAYDLKVTSGKGKMKVVRSKRHKNVWTVVIRKGKTYKLSVRAKGGSWKSIKYGIC